MNTTIGFKLFNIRIFEIEYSTSTQDSIEELKKKNKEFEDTIQQLRKLLEGFFENVPTVAPTVNCETTPTVEIKSLVPYNSKNSECSEILAIFEDANFQKRLRMLDERKALELAMLIANQVQIISLEEIIELFKRIRVSMRRRIQ